MRYHQQIIKKHDPANGQYGDCFRTTIACLLDLDCPMQVPHVMDGVETPEANFAALEKMNKWLDDVWGLRLIEIPFPAETLCSMLDSAAVLTEGCRYLLTGMSSAGHPHVVVCKGDQIEHCTSGNGLVGPAKAADGRPYFWVGLLVKVV